MLGFARWGWAPVCHGHFNLMAGGSVWHHWTGLPDGRALEVRRLNQLLGWSHLILPATLGIRPLAVVIQLTRNGAVDVWAYPTCAAVQRASWFVADAQCRSALNLFLAPPQGGLPACSLGPYLLNACLNGNGMGLLMFRALEQAIFFSTRVCFDRCSHVRYGQCAGRPWLQLARPTCQAINHELSDAIIDLEVVLKYRLVR